jgi:hypothetical protein
MMPAAAYAAGSPSNTTSAFDGTYTGGTIQNIGKGKQLDVSGESYGQKLVTA